MRRPIHDGEPKVRKQKSLSYPLHGNRQSKPVNSIPLYFSANSVSVLYALESLIKCHRIRYTEYPQITIPFVLIYENVKSRQPGMTLLSLLDLPPLFLAHTPIINLTSPTPAQTAALYPNSAPPQARRPPASTASHPPPSPLAEPGQPASPPHKPRVPAASRH